MGSWIWMACDSLKGMMLPFGDIIMPRLWRKLDRLTV